MLRVADGGDLLLARRWPRGSSFRRESWPLRTLRVHCRVITAVTKRGLAGRLPSLSEVQIQYSSARRDQNGIHVGALEAENHPLIATFIKETGQ